MALINCPECNKEISDSTNNCPFCGYPIKPTKKTQNKLWLILIAVVLIVAIITAGVVASLRYVEKGMIENNAPNTSTTEQTETTIKETSKISLKSNDDFSEIINAEADKSIKKMTDEYNTLSKKVGSSYSNYRKHKAEITMWYEECENEAQNFYNIMALYCKEYYDNVADNGLNDYKTWNRAMQDSYRDWNRCMQDYYGDWNDLYKDAFSDFEDATENAYKTVSYDEASDAYSQMYDEYSSSWSNMYDLYSDEWSNLYDFHDDVWEIFYDEERDVQAEYDRIYKK